VPLAEQTSSFVPLEDLDEEAVEVEWTDPLGTGTIEAVPDEPDHSEPDHSEPDHSEPDHSEPDHSEVADLVDDETSFVEAVPETEPDDSSYENLFAEEPVADEDVADEEPAAHVETDDEPADSPDAEPVPRFVEFQPAGSLTYLFMALFVAFAIGAVVTIFWAVSAGGTPAVVSAVGLTLLAMATWWALLNWTPAIVSISNGVLEISRGSDAVTWDLGDESTSIVTSGKTDSRAWKAVLKDEAGKSHTLTPSNVDPEQFMTIVDHYAGRA
jgi:hypothetical protein